MKTFFALLILIFTCLSSFGCDVNEAPPPNSHDGSSYVSEEESYIVNSEVDLLGARVHYKFLISPYTVTSRKSALDTTYEYEYFFIDGVVAGMRATVTFLGEEQAYAYYEIMAENDPFIFMTDTTVGYFSDSKGLYFDGYTPEQLCFALDNAGYDVVLNFDLKEFNKIFNEEIED